MVRISAVPRAFTVTADKENGENLEKSSSKHRKLEDSVKEEIKCLLIIRFTYEKKDSPEGTPADSFLPVRMPILSSSTLLGQIL